MLWCGTRDRSGHDVSSCAVFVLETIKQWYHQTLFKGMTKVKFELRVAL